MQFRKFKRLKGGCFRMEGAIFHFSQKIGLKSTKSMQFCILHKPIGGGSSPPRPPLATLLALSTRPLIGLSLSVLLSKDGSAVRYVGTVRYASTFAKKYDTLARYPFFVMVRVRYVGTLFELKIQDFLHIAQAFFTQKLKTAEADTKCVN